MSGDKIFSRNEAMIDDRSEEDIFRSELLKILKEIKDEVHSINVQGRGGIPFYKSI